MFGCLFGLLSCLVTRTTLLIATLLSTIQRNLHLCFNPQNRASTVTSRRGAVKPPSSLRVELPISIGPSTGPDPPKSGVCFDVVSFHPKVPAVSVKLPSEAMIRRRFARNARHTATSSAICSNWKRSRRYQGGSCDMYSARDVSDPGARGRYGMGGVR